VNRRDRSSGPSRADARVTRERNLRLNVVSRLPVELESLVLRRISAIIESRATLLAAISTEGGSFISARDFWNERPSRFFESESTCLRLGLRLSVCRLSQRSTRSLETLAETLRFLILQNPMITVSAAIVRSLKSALCANPSCDQC